MPVLVLHCFISKEFIFSFRFIMYFILLSNEKYSIKISSLVSGRGPERWPRSAESTEWHLSEREAKVGTWLFMWWKWTVREPDMRNSRKPLTLPSQYFRHSLIHQVHLEAHRQVVWNAVYWGQPLWLPSSLPPFFPLPPSFSPSHSPNFLSFSPIFLATSIYCLHNQKQ